MMILKNKLCGSAARPRQGLSDPTSVNCLSANCLDSLSHAVPQGQTSPYTKLVVNISRAMVDNRLGLDVCISSFSGDSS